MESIVVKNLTKEFKKKKAVDSVSFSVKRGEVFGLIGSNGAGKTTIISILSTLLEPTGGEARVAGFDVSREPRGVRKSIGLVFQESILDNDLSAYNNLDTYARLYKVSRKTAEQRIEKLLKLVDLFKQRKMRVDKFSGGMKRRLEIARGLIHEPSILFLDEPTIGLDPKARRLVWNYINELKMRTDLSIILTTHYLEEADVLCDRVAIMNKGKFLVCGSPRSLKQSLGGDIINVELNKRDLNLEEKIRSFLFVKKIRIQRNTLSLTLNDGEKHVVELIALINSFSLEIKSFNLRQPTLEDVFLYHTGKHLLSGETKNH